MFEFGQSDAHGLFIMPCMPDGEIREDLKTHVTSIELRGIILKNHYQSVERFYALFISEDNHQTVFLKDKEGKITFQIGCLQDLPNDLRKILQTI